MKPYKIQLLGNKLMAKQTHFLYADSVNLSENLSPNLRFTLQPLRRKSCWTVSCPLLMYVSWLVSELQRHWLSNITVIFRKIILWMSPWQMTGHFLFLGIFHKRKQKQEKTTYSNESRINEINIFLNLLNVICMYIHFNYSSHWHAC